MQKKLVLGFDGVEKTVRLSSNLFAHGMTSDMIAAQNTLLKIIAFIYFDSKLESVM